MVTVEFGFFLFYPCVVAQAVDWLSPAASDWVQVSLVCVGLIDWPIFNLRRTGFQK